MTRHAMNAVARVAASQHGLFTTTQAAENGIPPSTLRRWVAAGSVERLAPRVFAVPGAPDSWHRRQYAAVLAGGPDSVASHRAAARLYRLPGADDAGVELTVLGTLRPQHVRAIIHQTNTLPAIDRKVIDGIPSTAPERTLLDYAFVVSPEILEEAAHDALRRRLTTPDRLAARFAILGRRGRPGTAPLRTLLAERVPLDNPTGSTLELRFHRLARDGGIDLVPQYPVHDEQGAFVARVDFAIPDLRILIEIQSVQFHSGPRQIRADCRRFNRLRALGYDLRLFTGDDVDRRPDDTIAALRQAIAQARRDVFQA